MATTGDPQTDSRSERTVSHRERCIENTLGQKNLGGVDSSRSACNQFKAYRDNRRVPVLSSVRANSRQMGFNSSSARPFHQMLYRAKSGVSSAQARIEKEQVKQRQQLQKHLGSHELEVGDRVLLDSRELSLTLQKHEKALADTYV